MPPYDPYLPASLRYNNPGAMYPGPSASLFGSTGYGVIGGGHKIAQFPDPESGAAAQFNLLRNRYSHLPLDRAITTWSGGNSSPAYIQSVSNTLGVSPNTPVSDLLRDPTSAVGLAKSMAKFEAGRDYPLTDEQWKSAYDRSAGGDTSASAATTGPRKMPSLMDMFNPSAITPRDALGQQGSFEDALRSRSNSLVGMGLGLMQMQPLGGSGFSNALRGYQQGAALDERAGQNAFDRQMALRRQTQAEMSPAQQMIRDLEKYKGTPYEDQIKEFYRPKTEGDWSLVTTPDEQQVWVNKRTRQVAPFDPSGGAPQTAGGDPFKTGTPGVLGFGPGGYSAPGTPATPGPAASGLGARPPLVGPGGQTYEMPQGLRPSEQKEFRKKIVDTLAEAAGGKQNESQSKASSFAARMENAERDVAGFENQGLDTQQRAMEQYAPSIVSRRFMKPEYQRYTTARSQFITALLRRESGAAINQAEFTRYDNEFFPQPGDSPSIIEQKRNARKIATEEMRRSAGPGSQALTGPAAPLPGEQAAPAQPKGGRSGGAKVPTYNLETGKFE